MLVYGKYVRSLTRDELNALWRDYRVVGRRFGLREREMPRDIDAFEAYMAGMYASGDLFVTPAARELAVDIVLHPPVPLHARPLVELVNQITVGLLPAGIRRQYGFRWDPVRAVALHGGAEYVKRVVLPRSGLQPDLRVEHLLHGVGDEVRDRDQQHALDHEPHHHRHVAAQRGGVDGAEQAGDAEAVLDHGDVDQQRRDVDAGHRRRSRA